MPSQPRRSYQGDCCPGETLAVYKNRIKKEHDYNGIRNKTDAHPKSTQTPQNIELVISTRRSNTCYNFHGFVASKPTVPENSCGR